MFKFNRCIPITKIDEEERMVYGYASTPDLDSDGEIVSLGALKKALPEYLQFPTLREMHQPKAAGTIKNTEVREKGQKGLYIGAKVVADDAWDLVKEGVYRAFSIGGDIVSKVGNVISELDLVEISLVDVPANKKAKIDLWKSAGISKDAETAYSLSNLMVTLKDTILYFDAVGRSSKDLSKALELIKKSLVVEAGESEKESEERWDSMFLLEDVDDIKKLLKSLERISFEDNSNAEMLRRVVTINMVKKLEEKEEIITPDEEVETPEEEVVESPEDSEVAEVEETAETEEVTEVEEIVEETEEESEEETKDASAEPDFKKLDDITDKLEKLAKVEEVEKVDFGKGFEKVSTAMEKMVDIIGGLNERLVKLEAQPAALKSKKYIEVTKEGEKATEKEENSEVAKKKARLEELTKIFDVVGAAKFAKSGYSIEAGKLKDEISRLEA